jgi:hypothetical protein
VRGKPFDQELRDLERFATRRLRQDHGRVGSDIAMRRIARRLDRDAAEFEALGQHPLARERTELGNDDRAEMGEEISHVVAYLSKRR